jgi:H+-translocating NAD(P) transhydrogenase subunit beta
MADPLNLIVDLTVLAVFLLGIWRFREPSSARSGSLLVAVALVCGAAIVLSRKPLHGPVLVLIAVAIGSASGWFAAGRVTMTRIPAMVAFQNGAGGLAAALVSFVQLTREPLAAEGIGIGETAGILGLTIGALTFSGSVIASGRLASWLRQAPTMLPRHGAITLGLLAATVVHVAWSAVRTDVPPIDLAAGLAALGVLLGIVVSIRVGGADMPVLISFLNALSGLAAAFCGVAVGSRLLTACGATVAASGLILTHAMCRAMNRSWQSVLLGSAPRAVPGTAPAETVPSEQAPPEHSGSASRDGGSPEAAEPEVSPLDRAVAAIEAARKVIIVPGYGMALANAQRPAVQLAEHLAKAGKDAQFAIHPIAGRMPGHMHVLLAEAEVDPDLLVDLDDINPEFPDTDLVVIVGACDVVNPAAIHVEGTPISGMPVLSAHEAKQVLICNLDLRPGYSGVDNPLYRHPNAIHLLGDARDNLNQLLARLCAVSNP